VNPSNLDVMIEHPLLDPVTFELVVNRNLSASWYKQVPDLELSSRLGSIRLALDQLDYVFLMRLLNENMGEGGGGKAEAISGGETAAVDREGSAAIGGPAVHTAIMFTFSMESFVVSLHPGGYNEVCQKKIAKP